MAEAKVQVTISAKDQASSVFKKVGGSAADLGKTLAVGIAAGAAGVAAGLGLAVKSASDFEKQMSAVKAASSASGAEMAQLSGLALKLGQDTSKSASEAAAGIEELVKAGIPIDAVLNGAALAATNLSEATGTDMATAASVAAAAMSTFGKTGENMAGVTDTVTGAVNASSLSVESFALGIAAAGTSVAAAGGSFEDTATALAAMSRAGLSGSDASTSLKNMYTRLVPSTKEATEAMRELGLITANGKNQFFDASGSVKSYAEVSGILEGALGNLTNEQRISTLQTIFGADAQRAALIAMELGTEGAIALSEQVNRQGQAAEAAGARMDNLAGDVERLGGSAETAAIALGQAFQGPLREATQAVTNFVNDAIIPFINEHGRAFAEAATNAAKGLATGAGSLLEGAKRAAHDGLEVLREKLGEIGPALAEWASTAGEKGRAVGDALSGVSGIALALQRLLQGDFKGAMKEAETAFAQLGRAADAAALAIDETRVAIEKLSSTRTVLTGVQQVGDNLKATLDNLRRTAEILLPPFLRVSGAAGAAGEQFNIWNAAIAAVFGPIARFSEGALGMSKALLNTLQALDIVGAGFVAFAGFLGESLAAADAAVATFQNNVRAQLGAMVAGAVTAIGEFAAAIVAGLNGLIATAGAQAAAIGTSIVTGVIGGITARAGEVANSAANMVRNALQAARAAIGAESPSRDFAELGGDAVEGLVEGVEELTPDATQSGYDLGQALADGLAAGLDQTKMIEAGVDSLKGTLAGAMRDLAASVASIQGETSARFAQIGERAGQAFNQAIIAADSAIRSAVREADRRIGEMISDLALSRQIRGLRDAFGAGQDERSRSRSLARETEDLTRDRQREDHRRALELQRDLEKAKTAEERAAIMDRFAEASDDLTRRRKEEDEDRAYRRQREAEDREFRRQQDQERQNFEDRLEDDALARSIRRANEDRDERIKSINDALDEKQKQIKLDAEEEKKKLIEASADKIKTLKEEFIGKLPPLTAEAQHIIEGFLNGIDQALEEVRNTANAAIEAIANIPREVHVNVVTHHSDEGGDEGGGEGGGDGGEEESFAHGGVVPGPVGAPRHILAHGGETVVPTGGALGSALGSVVNVYVAGSVMTEVDLVDAVHAGLLRKERSNAGLFRT